MACLVYKTPRSWRSWQSFCFEGAALTVYPKNGDKPYDVELAAVSGYQGEIDYFCDVIEGKIKNDKNPASSAATTIRLIERMRESVNEGGKILSFR